ncbi:MAG: LON peptidase substrate-binding domain-containing protein [Bryobacteraceae bacterium]
MQDDLLPLFPLAVVLLPSSELPLHIFEDRYKEMIATVRRDQREFGVVLASGEGIASTGCTARIGQVVKEYEDGRLDIITVGQRRFTIRALDQEMEYLRGEVDFFDDDEVAAPPDLRQRAVRLCANLQGGAEPETVFDPDDPQLSFQLARRIDDLALRQQLLMSRSEAQRLQRLVEFLPAYSERVRQSERLRELAPKNGHGKLPRGLEED